MPASLSDIGQVEGLCRRAIRNADSDRTSDRRSGLGSISLADSSIGMGRLVFLGVSPSLTSLVGRSGLLDPIEPTLGRAISFIDSHTTIVSQGEDADNEKGNITTAAMGVSTHWPWLIRRAGSARVMVVPRRPAFQAANEPSRGRHPRGRLAYSPSVHPKWLPIWA